MRNLLLGLVATAFITACGTSPTKLSEATLIPPERVLYPSSNPADKTGILNIYRDGGFTGSALWVDVYIDGVHAAILSLSESVSLRVPIGKRKVASIWRPARSITREVEISEDNPITLRIGLDFKYPILLEVPDD
jgi:hypothetical protein